MEGENMIQPEYIPFGIAINETAPWNRAVLLGNGFSIAQSASFFYTNLRKVSGIDKNPILEKVFKNFDTVDFEKVMRHLENAGTVAEAYNRIPEATEYKTDAKEVRKHLIEAIEKVHPPDFDYIPPQEINSCGNFLKCFDKVFTLNYDLLLYWVLNSLRTPGLSSLQNFSDGFGLGKVINGLKGPFDTEAWCDTYNIHGGLHLFQQPDRAVHKAIASGNNLLSSIKDIIRQQSQLPLYVAEGKWEQKLAKIRSVPYLNYCLEELQGLSGTLFVFGHSGGSNDQHIYDAIFKSEIETLYYCIYDKSQRPTIGGLLEKYRLDRLNRRNRNTIIKFVDASPGHMSIWGKP